MVLARQPEDLQHLVAVEVARLGRRGVVGQPGARHVGPAEALERTGARDVQREAREHGEGVLARELTEAEGVVAVRPAARAHRAVAVEVEATRDTGVGREGDRVGVVDRVDTRGLGHVEEVVLEAPERDPALVVVELVEQQDVRALPLDDLRDVAYLLVLLLVGGDGEVAGQLTVGVPEHRDVERGEAGRRRAARPVLAPGRSGRRRSGRGRCGQTGQHRGGGEADGSAQGATRGTNGHGGSRIGPSRTLPWTVATA